MRVCQRSTPDYHTPAAHAPSRNEAVCDVGIVFCEAPCHASVFGAKDQSGAVDRIGKSSSHDDFTPLMSFLEQFQMIRSKRRAPTNKIVDNFVY